MRRKRILRYLENKSTGLDPPSSLKSAGEEIHSSKIDLDCNKPEMLTEGDKLEGDSEKTDRSWNEFFEQLQPESYESYCQQSLPGSHMNLVDIPEAI